MKAIVAEQLGSFSSYKVEEVALPSISSGEVLVRVLACGVGYVDSLIALGKYQLSPTLPHIPGQEISGVIEEVCGDVGDFKVGDNVFCITSHGMAQFAVVHSTKLYHMPHTMSFAQAAAFSANYLTAYHALIDRACLIRDEILLVLGAAGGVGSAAIQVGLALGAKVIGAASTEEKRNFVQALAAHGVIDTRIEEWRSRLMQVCGGKPDVIFDPVCGALFEPAFRSLAWRGRHLVVGFAAGGIPTLPANLCLLKGAALLGVDVLQFEGREPENARSAMLNLLDLVSQKLINPVVGKVFEFEAAQDALLAAWSGASQGKNVIVF